MPLRQSSGTLLYRNLAGELEVLLVHPSGNYNRHAPWGIPKGEPNEGESDMELTARRETLEETGLVAGALVSLGSIEYRKSRKRVHAYAGPAPADVSPRIASWEIDQARFMPIDEARRVIHPDQAAFLDRLREILESNELPAANES